MSWTAALLFLSLFFQLNQGGGFQYERPPSIQSAWPSSSVSDYATSNPLDFLVMNGPNEINMRFGMEFIDEVRKLKNKCEWKEYVAETDLQRERQELSHYREDIEELMEDPGFQKLPSDEQHQVENSFQEAYDNLLREEVNRENKLAKECNNELMKLEDERMEDALNFAKAEIAKGIGTFVAFVNQVDDYGKVVQNALEQCLDKYTNVASSKFYLVSMSPSDVCMQVEIGVLVRFIKEFVVRASHLVVSYSDDEDIAVYESGSGSFEQPPPRMPESFPRPFSPINQLPQQSDTVEEAETAEPDKSDGIDGYQEDTFDLDFDDPDQNHEPSPSPVSHEYTQHTGQELSSVLKQQATDKPKATRLPLDESSNPIPRPSPVLDGGVNRSRSKGKPIIASPHNQDIGLDRPQQSGRPFKPVRPNAGNGGRPGAPARPAPSVKPNRPGPYRRPGRPEGGVHQRPIRPPARPLRPGSGRESIPVNRPSPSLASVQQYTLVAHTDSELMPSTDSVYASSEEQTFSTLVVVIVFGAVAVLLILAILVLAMFIGITRYRNMTKGWTKLTEQEKIDLMKQSGYINPTYQFFDQVTQ